MDKTFEELWQDKNIRNIMNSVCSHYRRSLDFDDVESLQMEVLWKSMQKFDATRGTKFTSYLYCQISYALKNLLKKRKPEFTGIDLFDPLDHDYENRIQALEILSDADEETKDLLEKRFYHNMTMLEIGKTNGYSRETARRKLRKAIKSCKKKYSEVV